MSVTVVSAMICAALMTIIGESQTLPSSDLGCNAADQVDEICNNCAGWPNCVEETILASESRNFAECVLTCKASIDCQGVSYHAGTCSYLTTCMVFTPGDSSYTLYRKSCYNDCPVYNAYKYTSTKSDCSYDNTPSTAQPEVCFMRCLDTTGCTGATFTSSYGCWLHSCTTNNQASAIFSTTTLFTKECTAPPTTAPPPTTTTSTTAPPPTTTTQPITTPLPTTTTSTTTLPPSTTTTPTTTLSPITTTSTTTPPTTTITTTPTTTPLPTTTTTTTTSPTTAIFTTTNVHSAPTTTAPLARPIYLTPCRCQQGTFTGMTIYQIIDKLVQNVTIDAKKTGSARRKFESVEDTRASSTTAGYLAGCLLTGLILAICANDFISACLAVINFVIRLKRMAYVKYTRSKS